MGGSSGGGGGTGTQNVNTTVTQTNIPEEFYPYLQKQMQMADALLQQDYIPYEGERTAAYTPEQQAAFQGITSIAQRSLPGVTGARSFLSSQIAEGATPDYLTATGAYTAPTTGAAGYTPTTTFGSGYAGSQIAGGYSPTAGTFAGGYAPTRADFGGGYSPTRADFGSGYTGANIASTYDPRTQTFGSGYQGSTIDPRFTGATIQSSYDPTAFRAQRVVDQMEQYQNPFLEDVLDRSVARLQEQFDTQQAARDLASTQAGGAGAFGSRGALARLTAQDQASRAIGDLEASQRAKAFDTALRAATADVDRDLRVQQLSDAAAQRAAQLGLTAQQATGAFAQAAGAQDLQAQIAEDAARRAAGTQILTAQQLQDAASRARGVQDIQAQTAADAAARAAGAQTLTAQQLRDQAARAAGQQTLSAQQLADQALRAAGAQTLQAQIAGDAALRAAGAQTLQGQIASDAAARAAGQQALTAQQLTDAAARAAGAQDLDAFRLTQAAAQAAGDQTLRQSLANQRAYQEALARQDRAAAAGISLDRAEQALDLQRIGALSALGGQQRADAQAILDTQYADFLRQREFPREQLAFYSNLLRGVNPGQFATQTTRQAAPAANQSGQLLNFLMGAAQLAA